MRPEVRQGWDDDPFGLHQRRYFSAGEPTKLVEDDGVESYDPPPTDRPLPSTTPPDGAPTAFSPSGAPPARAWTDPVPDGPGISGPGAGTPPVDPGPPPRRRRRVLAAVGAAVGLIAGITIGLVVSNGGTGPHASAAVITSTAATMEQGSAHVSVSLHGTAGPAAIEASGQGAVDFSHRAATFALTVHAAGQSQTIQLVQDGPTLYLSTPQIAQLVPGKSWASITESPDGSPDAGSLSPVVGAGDPSDIIKKLSAAGATVTDLGQSTIDGVVVEGYHVVPPAPPKGSAAASLSAVSMSFDVYVDGANLLRRVHVTLSGRAASQAIALDGTVDLSEYGSPVTVAPPPADQVLPFSQLLGPHGPLGSATGSFPL